MMIHAYHAPWDSSRHIRGPAHRRGVKRAATYFTFGYIDPRTYTLEPWAIARTTGTGMAMAFAASLQLAAVTAWTSAALGYMGYDPMNVTPGYGMSPGDNRDRFGREIDHKEIKPRYLM